MLNFNLYVFPDHNLISVKVAERSPSDTRGSCDEVFGYTLPMESLLGRLSFIAAQPPGQANYRTMS